MYYNFFKLPGGCLLYVEWKNTNTQFYSWNWCCGELFICVGIWRLIYTPFFSKPKKPKATDEHNNEIRGAKDKPSRSSIIPFENSRKVS